MSEGKNAKALVPVEDRFWAKVRATGFCWEWTAFVGTHGYGQFSTPDGKTHRAHRLAYEILVGAIPDGAMLDHLCRNVICVNPDHLEPVSARENTLRGFSHVSANARKTHCKRGHEFNEANTRIVRKGRLCIPCQRAHSKEWKVSQRNARNS